MKTIRTENQNGIVIVTFDAPDSPVNTMGEVWQADMDALAAQLAAEKDGIRGIFICGQQDMLESYVIAKIWDDPSADVDEIISEFFRLYFGAAEKPMKEFYQKLEETACNPDNYRKPWYRKNGIDWKNVAWTQLGTADRMKEFGSLIAEAEQLAATEQEKKRVALWRDALWKWMEEGRAQHLKNSAEKSGGV